MVSDGVLREMRSTTRKRWDDRDRVRAHHVHHREEDGIAEAID